MPPEYDDAGSDKPKARKHAIQATTLSEEVGRRWIDQLLTGRQNPAQGGRFKALHDAIKERDKAFHNENPPQFGPPFESMVPFQSDVIRREHEKAMIRLTEHPIRVQVKPPKDTTRMRDGANRLAIVFETGLELEQERSGESLLGQLGDGQLRHCYGVLHWYKRREVYPDYPDPMELDDEPNDDEKGDFRKYASDEQPRRKGARYRETEARVAERDKRARASAGFAYCFEVPRPDQFAFLMDKGSPNGMGLAVTVVSIGALDYDEGARKEGYCLDLSGEYPKLDIYEEEARPEQGEPSADVLAWGKQMRIARLWTRTECYEFGAYAEQAELKLLRSWQHKHKMPPFALALAIKLNEPDPVKAYLPFLMGLYRTKPDYDYERSLGRALAEQTAIPRYWIELADGSYMMDPNGNKLVLSEDAATAMSLPPGAKLVKADITIDPAFVAFLDMSSKDVEAAIPETGFVEVGASTAPHTLNMAQAQANAPIAYLKSQQVLAIRTALRNIAMVESGEKESLVVMAKSRGTDPVAGSIIEVKPEEIPGLDIDVAINPNSGAQEVAISEYHRGLLNDPNVPFTRREWLEKTGREDPDRAIENWLAEQAEFKALPRVVDQELARQFGDTFVVVPGGKIVGAGGMEMDPMAVLASQGILPPPPPPEAMGGNMGPGAPVGAPAGLSPLPAVPPALEPLASEATNMAGTL